jgi:hypothetical protein
MPHTHLSRNPLADAHPIHGLPTELKVYRRLKNEHNRRAKVKISHLLSRRHFDAAKVLPFPILPTFGVGGQILVKIDDDAADVGGPDSGHGKEAVAPATEKRHPFVGVEEAGHFLDYVRRHAVEFAGKMAPFVDGPRGRRVEAMVVGWTQVDDSLVQHVSACNSDQLINT